MGLTLAEPCRGRAIRPYTMATTENIIRSPIASPRSAVDRFVGVSEKTILGKVLRFPLRLIPAGICLPVLQGPMRGFKWIIGSSIHGCWLGSYESAKQKRFSIAVKRGDVVYDIGANVGFYSLLASALVGPAGKVFSFEPVPRNLHFLERHLHLNDVKNCSVLEAAVGRVDGTANFDTGPHPAMGHLTNDETRNGLKVRILALDRLIASGRLPAPDVIKCDIEGGEYDALQGALDTLARFTPAIFLATHGADAHEKCCRLLTGLRYRLTPIDGLSLEESSEILATFPAS